MSVPPEEGAWLEAADGTCHPIKGSCSLGRSGANTIVLESPKVSRRHALIHLQNIGKFRLIDFGSSNGTALREGILHVRGLPPLCATNSNNLQARNPA